MGERALSQASHRRILDPMRRAVALLLCAACGGDDDLVYQGTAGRPMTASFSGWVPSVNAAVDDQGGALLLDSGSPLTLLDNDHFTALPDGLHQVDLAIGELSFPGLPALAFDVISYAQGRVPPLTGIVGGDVLTSFAFSLDYAGGRIWLDDQDPALPAGAENAALGEPIEIAAEVAGGGVYNIPAASREVGATRFLVRIEIEDAAEPFWALVDTGASSVVVAGALIEALGPVDRPRLDGVIVGTATGPQTAYFTRLWRMRLAEGAELGSVPVLVLPDDSVFESVSSEVSEDVRLIVGGSYLRWFLTTLDYPDRALVLRPYLEPDHVDPAEFIGVGFEIEPVANEWRVATVYPGTDAEAEGLQVGEVVLSLDGTTVTGLAADQIDSLLAGFELGEDLPVGIERGGEMTEVLVRVEDLLPDFDSP
jgi:hypothetical protein